MVGGDGTATGEKRSTSGAFRPKTLGTQVLNDHRHRPLKVSTTPARELAPGLPQHLPQLRKTMPVPVIDTAKT